eukprot:1329242-Amphidinium_carterae.1
MAIVCMHGMSPSGFVRKEGSPYEEVTGNLRVLLVVPWHSITYPYEDEAFGYKRSGGDPCVQRCPLFKEISHTT